MKHILMAVTAVAALSGSGAAYADQSGLAGMHAQNMVKGRLCFTSHTHVGTGTGQRTKRAAIASAASDWSSFTSFEYGSSWANWRTATAKTFSCEPSGGRWTCEVQARPCLMGRTRGVRQARR